MFSIFWEFEAHKFDILLHWVIKLYWFKFIACVSKISIVILLLIQVSKWLNSSLVLPYIHTLSHCHEVATDEAIVWFDTFPRLNWHTEFCRLANSKRINESEKNERMKIHMHIQIGAKLASRERSTLTYLIFLIFIANKILSPCQFSKSTCS